MQELLHQAKMKKSKSSSAAPQTSAPACTSAAADAAVPSGKIVRAMLPLISYMYWDEARVRSVRISRSQPERL